MRRLKRQQCAMRGPKTLPMSLTLFLSPTLSTCSSVWVQVWLPAMKAKGLEVSGTFARRGGIIQMDLSLNNKAMSVMTDFAIQFNRNR